MWMARNGAAEQARLIDFKAACDEGLAHLDEIAAEYRDSLALAAAEIKDYLTRNIAFQMDEKMKQGLEFYFELARKHGLTRHIKPLEFVSYS